MAVNMRPEEEEEEADGNRRVVRSVLPSYRNLLVLRI